MSTPITIFENIDAKLDKIIELLKPKAKPAPEEWEDVTAEYLTNGRVISSRGGTYQCIDADDRIRKIEGMHNGPAFIIERRKA